MLFSLFSVYAILFSRETRPISDYRRKPEGRRSVDFTLAAGSFHGFPRKIPLLPWAWKEDVQSIERARSSRDIFPRWNSSCSTGATTAGNAFTLLFCQCGSFISWYLQSRSIRVRFFRVKRRESKLGKYNLPLISNQNEFFGATTLILIVFGNTYV